MDSPKQVNPMSTHHCVGGEVEVFQSTFGVPEANFAAKCNSMGAFSSNVTDPRVHKLQHLISTCNFFIYIMLCAVIVLFWIPKGT